MEKYRKENKEKIKQKQKEYRLINLEKIKQREKIEREKNPDKTKAKLKKYYDKNKAVLLEKKKTYRNNNKEKIQNLVKDWATKNPEKISANNSKRRSARIHRTPSWLTTEQLLRIESLYAESIKRRLETGLDWHVDHIIPLQGKLVSGLHVPENMQIILAQDNVKKGNRYQL